MKIGILVMFVNSFGKRGLYNSQEIGMAKELAKRGHSVTIYRCVDDSEKRLKEIIFKNVLYITNPVRSIGINAYSDFEWMDSDIDLLICFSDIQLFAYKAYNWTVKNQIIMIPYVGIAHSQTRSILKKKAMNLLANRTFKVYKKIGALAKTKAVERELRVKGIKDLDIAPVGLDGDLLEKNYHIDKKKIKEELDLEIEKKYIMLVGRVEEDRNSTDIIELFEGVIAKDVDYRAVIIGIGSLEDSIKEQLRSRGLDCFVKWIGQVPNNQMWKYYRACDCLVSFSREEIFGMSILEAMYYELPVHVIHAPGPDDIIVNREAGYLYDDVKSMIDGILQTNDNGVEMAMGKKEHNRIEEYFTWKSCVDKIEKRYKRILEA